MYDQRTITYVGATNISKNTQFAKFAKYNSTPKFVDLQYHSHGALPTSDESELCSFAPRRLVTSLLSSICPLVSKIVLKLPYGSTYFLTYVVWMRFVFGVPVTAIYSDKREKIISKQLGR